MTAHTLARLSIAAVCLGAASTAVAQEQGQVGVTFGYPASAGLIWHATDRVAVRGSVEFAHSSVESEYGPEALTGIPGLPLPPPIPSYETESSSTNWSFAFSGLFYFGQQDGVSPYVSPRYSIDRISRSSTIDYELYLPVSIPDRDEVTIVHAFGGFFGVQYAPSRRFSMFAEVGVEYQTSGEDLLYGRIEARTTAAKAGVGVILYFR